ncbi:protein kilB [Streptomyces sp. ME02-6979.5a]|uniref:protein kilB n=1 Tax=Streptomyces sp. ME02-6979.5a TaxID=462925 RepID=UPI0029B7D526|nr:protein kilB [Streptomyces sp. ME02-6979.5a]MDX3343520.1 protein kilB [Streptomyces sp. ME02-6979.5a]
MFPTIIAVLGTLAGVAITSTYQARAARTALQETRRTEGLAAVETLAAALADHRRAMWAREDLRLRGEDWSTARAESHTTRAAITAPLIRVQILLPAAAGPARAAVQAVYDLRGAEDHTALAEARSKAIRMADEFVPAAGTVLAP